MPACTWSSSYSLLLDRLKSSLTHLTLRQIAEASGFSVSRTHRLITGEVPLRVSDLYKLSGACEIPLAALLDDGEVVPTSRLLRALAFRRTKLPDVAALCSQLPAKTFPLSDDWKMPSGEGSSSWPPASASLDATWPALTALEKQFFSNKDEAPILEALAWCLASSDDNRILPATAYALGLLAAQRRSVGKLSEALEIWILALEIAEKLGAEDLVAFLARKSITAISELPNGVKVGLRIVDRCISVFARVGKSRDLAAALIQRGYLLRELHPHQAKECYLRGIQNLSASTHDEPLLFSAYHGLALIELGQGDDSPGRLDLARKWIENAQSLAVSQSATALLWVVGCYREKEGDLSSALDAYRDLSRRATHPMDRALAMLLCIRCSLGLGNLSEASITGRELHRILLSQQENHGEGGALLKALYVSYQQVAQKEQVSEALSEVLTRSPRFRGLQFLNG